MGWQTQEILSENIRKQAKQVRMERLALAWPTLLEDTRLGKQGHLLSAVKGTSINKLLGSV